MFNRTQRRFHGLFLVPLAALALAGPVSAVTVNVARVGTATQSSTRNGSATEGDIAQVAVDGNTNGTFGGGSVTHTASAAELNTFWRVDLNADRAIDDVILFNRTDCCGTRLSNFVVSVLDSGNNVVSSQAFAGTVGANQSFNFGGVIGRTVQVQLNPQNLDAGSAGVLSIAEVQVFSDIADNDPLFFAQGRNVARLGTASQSSTRTGPLGAGGGNKAILAIDGNTNGAFSAFPDGGSVSHTNNELTPSWTVDLNGTFKLDNLIIHERTDVGQDALLNNFTVSVLDAGLNVIHSQVVADVATLAHLALPFDTEGKFVRIQMNDTGAVRSLQLAEVQIFGGELANVARNPLAVASQSSTDFSGDAARAIDGITDGVYARSNSVTHTATQNNPFWTLDLGADFNIDEIVLFNRMEGFENRLSGAEIRLFSEHGQELFLATLGDTTGLASFRFDVEDIRARSLQILLPGSNRVLSLAEVQVYGVASIPEPATFALLGLGVIGLVRRRRPA